MSETGDLLARIDAEFNAFESRVKDFQERQVTEFEGRKARLEQYSKLLEELRHVWAPRLETLAERFGDRVQVTPTVTSTRREGTFTFQSPLARITLTFAAFPDQEARHVVFAYELKVLPILMKFQSHAEISFPIDAIDAAALGKWVDDRIVDFVRTYIEIHQNQYYLKDQLVEDPVAKVSFPRFAAGATLEVDGKTLYFIGEETKKEFAARSAM